LITPLIPFTVEVVHPTLRQLTTPPLVVGLATVSSSKPFQPG
jgi:hypothetical protein